jgi:hypothetical protein
VSCANRILANCMRTHFDAVASRYIGAHQRGFLWQRFITSNVVDIDVASMKVRATNLKGATILVDFQAAFPSLDHEFLKASLIAIGFPREVVNALTYFYVDNKHFIRVQGKIFNSITVLSGVRQGCPLSPVLFILCMESFFKCAAI